MTIELSKNVIDAIADAIIKKEVEEMAKFPTYEEFAKKAAEKALDEFLYNGKSIREWMQIIASKDAISRQTVLSYIYNDLGLGDEENGADVERQMALEDSYRYVKSLSPVAPQSKTGHWFDIDENSAVCSCCNRNNILYGDFCKWCGARMIKP